MIPLFKVYMSPDVDGPLLETLHSGWVGEGKKVKEFQERIGEFVGNRNCRAVSAGTHALHLALILAGVKRGDSVVTTSLSCCATPWSILYQDADIAWADIQPNTLNLDSNDVERKLTDRTKAVLCVHWGGYPCDMDALREMTQKRGIALIEDAAHAFGAKFGDRMVGACNMSDHAIFSFQAIKTLTTVDGGALMSSNPFQHRKGRLLSWYGMDRESKLIEMRCCEPVENFGFKYHMNDVCATIGLENFKTVELRLAACRDNAMFYDEALKDFSGLTLLQQGKDRLSSYWLYSILVEDRESFVAMMGSRHIHVSRVHERCDRHPCVMRYRTELPALESVIHRMICIPVGAWVTKEDREYIVDAIKGGW